MGWQWHQLGHMQIICTSLQTDNHASTSPLRWYIMTSYPHQPLKFQTFKNPKWWMTTILKTVKWPYLTNSSNDGNKIWHGHALCPMNFTLPGHTLHLLFYIINLQNIIKTKLALVSPCCTNHCLKTANINILSANSKHTLTTHCKHFTVKCIAVDAKLQISTYTCPQKKTNCDSAKTYELELKRFHT